MKVKNDPKNYELMSEPFETEDDLRLAFAAFDKDLSRIRKKHRIAELLVVKIGYLENSSMTAMGTYGSELMVLPMAQVSMNSAIELQSNLLKKLAEELNSK